MEMSMDINGVYLNLYPFHYSYIYLSCLNLIQKKQSTFYFLDLFGGFDKNMAFAEANDEIHCRLCKEVYVSSCP